MTQRLRDRPRRWPPDSLITALALFLIMLVGGAALYMAALNSLLAARQDLSRESEQLRVAREELRLLPQRIALAQAAETDFQRMARLGFDDDGDRLDWVSALARVGRRMGLRTEAGAEPTGNGVDSLTWQLEPRQRHAMMPGLWVTPMTLRIAPISPAGLGELLRGLAAEARGHFSVDSCALALDSAPDAPHAGQAECRLRWWNWRGDTHAGGTDTAP